MPTLGKKKEVKSVEEGSPIIYKALPSKDKERSPECNNLIPLGIRDTNQIQSRRKEIELNGNR